MIEDFFPTLLITYGLYCYFRYLTRDRNVLFVKKNNINAQLPTKGSKYSAGYDLHSCEEGIIKANSMGKIDIGISLVIPPNHYGRIAPRSGLTLNYSLNVGAGVIDSDYRGVISVILFNHGNKDFKYNIGDRIAQIIIEKISHCRVYNIDDLDITTRGKGGFGSTGVSNNNINIEYSSDEETETNDEETENNDEENNDEENNGEETETNDEETNDEETETNDEETETNEKQSGFIKIF